MPRAATITEAQRRAVLEVVKLRLLIPTNKQLARQQRLSIRSVKMISDQYRESLLTNESVSRETIAGKIACDVNGPDRIQLASR